MTRPWQRSLVGANLRRLSLNFQNETVQRHEYQHDNQGFLRLCSRAASSRLLEGSGGAGRSLGRCRLSSTAATTPTTTTSPTLHWLDLQGIGLSTFERLYLEEALLRHDPHQRWWVIVGTHDAVGNRHLKENVVSSAFSSRHCIIVLGLGGKAKELLHVDAVRRDGIPVLRRFSGGGTVLLDPNSLWTTLIGRNTTTPKVVEAYPRSIMQWSYDAVFSGAFDVLAQQVQAKQEGEEQLQEAAQNNNSRSRRSSLVMHSTSCGIPDMGRSVLFPSKDGAALDAPTSLPSFQLFENDYVLDFGEAKKKMGGNAQCIVQQGWLHHTSWLWDFDASQMSTYLTLPAKRPVYRGERSHGDFLTPLQQVYGGPGLTKRDFFRAIRSSLQQQVQPVTWNELLQEWGPMEGWFGTKNKCRTKVVTEF